jgi:hypothetical protein
MTWLARKHFISFSTWTDKESAEYRLVQQSLSGTIRMNVPTMADNRGDLHSTRVGATQPWPYRSTSFHRYLRRSGSDDLGLGLVARVSEDLHRNACRPESRQGKEERGRNFFFEAVHMFVCPGCCTRYALQPEDSWKHITGQSQDIELLLPKTLLHLRQSKRELTWNCCFNRQYFVTLRNRLGMKDFADLRKLKWVKPHWCWSSVALLLEKTMMSRYLQLSNTQFLLWPMTAFWSHIELQNRLRWEVMWQVWFEITVRFVSRACISTSKPISFVCVSIEFRLRTISES